MSNPTRNKTIVCAAAGVVFLAIAAGLYYDWRSAEPPGALAQATFVGRQACVACHQEQHDDWVGSHHDMAMDLATDDTVLGDFSDVTFERLGVKTRFFRDGQRFMVNTEGPDGRYADYQVKYTLGVDPLQQYMVELEPRVGGIGRVQVLRVSWDTHRKCWFEVTPPDVTDERIPVDDPLHWTGITQNWNTTCAVCHSTNLQKNYDLATNSYATTYSEIDVSCEECHGPASLHVELAEATSLFWDRRHGYGLANLKSADSSIEIEACAECHSRRNAVHADFRPGTPLLDSYEVSLIDEGLYHADGQILDEVYVYGSFVQSRMHAKGVRCTDCHDPHSLELERPGNRMCAKCHEPAKYDVVAHHHHPDPKPGEPSVGAQCVNCHMPATTYMVVDPRRDHSLRVPRPDLTVSTGAPNACNGCHTAEEENATWAAQKVVEWYGDRADRLAGTDHHGAWHWAPALAAGRAGEPNGEKLLAEVADRETAPTIIRASAVQLLQRYQGSDAVKAIRGAHEAEDPLIRLAAVRATPPQTVDPQAVELLAARLEDPAVAVRMEASRRLASAPEEMLTPDQRAARVAGLKAFRERQSLINEHAGSHMNLSNLALEQSDREGAIDELRKAIRLEPYLNGPRGQLASLLEAGLATHGDSDPWEIDLLRREEIKLLERDAGYAPDNANIRYRLGLLRYKVGDLDAAEQALAEAADRDQRSYEYLMALVLVQEQRYVRSRDPKRLAATADSIKRLHALDPQDPRAGAILRRLAAAQRAIAGDEESAPAP